MPIEMDPVRIKTLMPGNVLVEIQDKLGRTTKTGLFIPGHLEDRWDRDTAYGKVLKTGAKPDLVHEPEGKDFLRNDPRDPTSGFRHSGKPWPDEYAKIEEGDIVLFPRDVPLVITYRDKRYGIIHWHEIIAVSDEAFEVNIHRTGNQPEAPLPFESEVDEIVDEIAHEDRIVADEDGTTHDR